MDGFLDRLRRTKLGVVDRPGPSATQTHDENPGVPCKFRAEWHESDAVPWSGAIFHPEDLIHLETNWQSNKADDNNPMTSQRPAAKQQLHSSRFERLRVKDFCEARLKLQTRVQD